MVLFGNISNYVSNLSTTTKYVVGGAIATLPIGIIAYKVLNKSPERESEPLTDRVTTSKPNSPQPNESTIPDRYPQEADLEPLIYPQGADLEPLVYPQGADLEPLIYPQGADLEPLVYPQGADLEPLIYPQGADLEPPSEKDRKLVELQNSRKDDPAPPKIVYKSESSDSESEIEASAHDDESLEKSSEYSSETESPPTTPPQNRATRAWNWVKNTLSPGENEYHTDSDEEIVPL